MLFRKGAFPDVYYDWNISIRLIGLFKQLFASEFIFVDPVLEVNRNLAETFGMLYNSYN